MKTPSSWTQRAIRCALVFIACMLAAGSSPTARSQGCGTLPAQQPQQPAAIGGMYLPSGNGMIVNGIPTSSPATIYALVIFLEFGDDDTPNSDSWTKGTAPTLMMQDFIDRPAAPFSGNKYNLTTYFRDMSGDKLRILGDCYYTKTRYTLAQYRAEITQAAANAAGHPEDAGNDFSTNVRYWALRHVLEDMGRAGWDFSVYDRWNLRGYFDYEEAVGVPSDGIVDLLVACWRNHGSIGITQDESFTIQGKSRIEGIADLGLGTPIQTGIGTKRRTITFGEPGSGVSAFDLAQYPRMETVPHEIGHRLLGGDHHYGGGMWALMGQQNKNVSACANAYERSRLGWGTIQYIQNDGETHTLTDYATTHQAYALTANTSPGEYFLIENHQRLPSPYISAQGMTTLAGRPWGNSAHDRYWNVPTYDIIDQTIDPADNGAEGLYIIHQKFPAANCEQCLQVMCADGKWIWAQEQCPFGTVGAPWNGAQQLAVWKRATIDRNLGTCDRQAREIGSTCDPVPSLIPEDFLWAWEDPENGGVVNDMAKQRGDRRDMWETQRSTVFSQWSNPSSRASLGSNTTVGMEVLSKVGNNYNVKFYLTSALSAPPSRPQDVKVSYHDVSMSNGHTWLPRITWNLNQEPDVATNGIYHIERRTEWSNGTPVLNWTEIATVDGSVATYDDAYFWDDVSPFDGTIVRYRIRAEDTQELLSGISEQPAIPFQGAPKLALPPEAVTGSLAGLEASCAPNPCSDRGAITYLLPSDGHVRLTLYDALGRRVAVLADDVQTAGRHNAWFDASELVPGVYAWVLEFGGERVGERMVVVR